MTDPSTLNLGLLLFIPYRAMESAVLDELRAQGHDLPISQARVFQRIGPQGTRMSDLARAAQVSKQTLGSIVDQLERRGYVQRVPDPADARGRIVTISPLGRRLVDLGRPVVEKVEAGWSARLGPEDTATLRRLLEELVRESED
ncbi:MarR family transcriptional regulator [Nocardioides sp.]|uniref:MarR family winged helix-turn-helix transcriptional regulator n=1 Tax=Nocardioides sp. TaxID=35761 RepID=UPI0025DBAF4B|nr:MarR family transcriptional regulator [Nocardioides sp.]